MMDITQRECDLIKEIGEIERDCRERIKPLQEELDKLSQTRNYIVPLAEPKPLFGSVFRQLFGFDLI